MKHTQFAILSVLLVILIGAVVSTKVSASPSGSGATEGMINGLGNLIVGYNEDVGSNATRTGSHNLVVGIEHSYSSYAGSLRQSLPYALLPGTIMKGRMREELFYQG